MARRCYFCEKRPVVGHKVSHSNIKTKIRHLPNLQRVRASIDGLATRVYACTRCLRSGILAKPLVRNYKPVEKPGTEAAAANA